VADLIIKKTQTMSLSYRKRMEYENTLHLLLIHILDEPFSPHPVER